MSRSSDFIFARIEEKGQILPGTRWDIFLSLILALAMMAAIGYSAQPHGWTVKRGLIVGATAVIVACFAQNLKVALGGAFCVVASRMAIGLFTGQHAMTFAVGTIAAICGAWTCLRDLK